MVAEHPAPWKARREIQPPDEPTPAAAAEAEGVRAGLPHEAVAQRRANRADAPDRSGTPHVARAHDHVRHARRPVQLRPAWVLAAALEVEEDGRGRRELAEVRRPYA